MEMFDRIDVCIYLLAVLGVDVQHGHDLERGRLLVGPVLVLPVLGEELLPLGAAQGQHAADGVADALGIKVQERVGAVGRVQHGGLCRCVGIGGGGVCSDHF